MKTWHLLVGFVASCAIGLLLAYLAILGLAVLYHDFGYDFLNTTSANTEVTPAPVGDAEAEPS